MRSKFWKAARLTALAGFVAPWACSTVPSDRRGSEPTFGGAPDAGAPSGTGNTSDSGSPGAGTSSETGGMPGNDEGGAAGVAPAAGGTSAGEGGEPSVGAGGEGPEPEPTEGLRVLATLGKPGVRCIGTAISGPALTTDANYTAVAAREFNCVVSENDMKWVALQPSRGTFNFTEADKLVTFAKAHDMHLKGHALLWHGSMPAWLTSITDAEDLREVIVDHVTTVVSRFKGKVEAWDVVNEAVAEYGGDYRATHFYNVLGKSYIRLAFEAARAADPNVKLYYNDYNVEAAGPKSDFTYDMLAELIDDGVPIDGVGLQSHLTHTGVAASELTANIERFAALGLSVNLSEIDVRMGQASGSKEQKLAGQADIYRTLSSACTKHPACDGVWVWGFTDATSWIDGYFGGTNFPCLFDEALMRKPAYDGYKEGLGLPNLVANWSFETDAKGWNANGAGVVQVSTDFARTGSQSALVTGRQNAYEGPAYSLLDVALPGQKYDIEGYVRVDATSAPAFLTAKWTCPGMATVYTQLKNGMATDQDWLHLKGVLNVPSCGAHELAIYFEGPPAGVGLYVDDVVAQQQP